MQTSIFIARLLAPFFVIGGIAFLSRPEAFRAMAREFIASRVLVYLAGVLGLLGGTTLVLTHNVWALDWRLLITLIGWTTIIRAVITIFQPQLILSAGTKLLDHANIYFGAAAVDLLIGLILCYFGYLA